jgi:hypothetical protein
VLQGKTLDQCLIILSEQIEQERHPQLFSSDGKSLFEYETAIDENQT